MRKLKITLLIVLPLIFFIIGSVSVDTELLDNNTSEENVTMVCEQIMYNIAGTLTLFNDDCASGGQGSSSCSSSSSSASCDVECNDGYYSCCDSWGYSCTCKVSTEPEESG
ncbi:MAG: hypothetical protein JJU37_02925 [Balneolaceae bacterium]|nr:hypothetical protein [Balneolaceae bacterium]